MKSFEKLKYSDFITDSGNLRSNYFSLSKPHFKDVIVEYLDCLQNYINNYLPVANLLDLFYSILCHISHDVNQFDPIKAQKFVNKTLCYLQNGSEINVPTIDISEIASKKCPYYQKTLILSEINHSIFVNIIKETKSVYLPLYMRQNLPLTIEPKPLLNHKNIAPIKIRSNDSNILNDNNINIGNSDIISRLSTVSIYDSANTVTCASVNSNDWSKLALGKRSGDVFLSANDSTYQIKAHSSCVSDIKFIGSNDQQYLLSCSLDNTVKLWSSDIVKDPIQTYNVFDRAIWTINCSPFVHNWFLVGSGDSSVYLYDASMNHGPLRQFSGHLDVVNKVKFNQYNQHYIVSGGADGHVRLWDIRTGYCVRLWGSSAQSINFLEWTSESELIWSNGNSSVEKINISETSSSSRNVIGTCASGVKPVFVAQCTNQLDDSSDKISYFIGKSNGEISLGESNNVVLHCGRRLISAYHRMDSTNQIIAVVSE